MSARKPIRRLSRYSIQSQVSGVLDPDSNIASDEESQALWFRDFENTSVNIRPSARFSLAQSESAVLDSNSEVESTPLQKSWWKNLENTPDVRFSKSNVSGERSNVQEGKDLEISDTSPSEEGLAKRRFPMPRKKRKSLQRNIFSEILDGSKDSIASEKSVRNKQNEDRQTTIDSSSDSDQSIGKVKKLLFKNRKRNKLAKKLRSDESLPEAFQQALDASQSGGETLGEAVPPNEPGNSMGNKDISNPDSPTSGESIRLELDPVSASEERIMSKEPKAALQGDKDLERSRSPVMTSRLKKRTVFTKTAKRRTANFDELLNNVSDETFADQPSIGAELESNRDERQEETVAHSHRKSDSERNISARTDETDSEESIIKQRVPFGRKKQQSRKEKTFTQLSESLNISIHSEPANTSQKTRESELSRHRTPLSDVERRSSKRKSSLVESSVPLNFQVEGDQSARKLRRLNMSGSERRSIHETGDQADISGSLNAELQDNQSVSTQIRPSSIGRKSSAVRRSIIEKSNRAETSGASNKELKENHSVKTPSHLSSVGNKSGTERRSTNKQANESADSSGSSDAELEDNQLIGTHIRPSSIGNKSSTAKQSMNEKNDRAGTSGDSNIELKENHSVRTSSRLSSVGNKSGTQRHSTNKQANKSAESSGSSNDELEENHSVRTPSRLSGHTNKSGTERRSTNKKTNDELLYETHREESSGSPNAELEENQSISTLIYPSRTKDKSGSERRSKNEEKDLVGTTRSVIVEEEANRRSSVFKKPRDLSKSKKSLSQSRVNKSQSSTQANYASSKVHDRSRSAELPASTDEEEDEEEMSENLADFPSVSDVIDETRQDQNSTNNSRLPLRDASSATNMEVTIPLETPNKYVDQRKTASGKKSGSMVAQNLEKTVGALQRSNLIADGIENTEIRESGVPDVGEITQSVTEGTQRSFSSVDHNRTGSVQPGNESLGIGSQVSQAEKLSQLKSALEKIKGKEIVLKKTTTIDSYFKKTLPSKPAKDPASKDSKKPPSQKKPVVNESKTASVSPNKAYIVNGKVYKRPKLPRPKSWATDRLYNYLWKKMEAKFQLKTRVRSEQFIVDLSQVVAIIVRRQKYDNYKSELNNLIREMARLGIIKTRNDFHIFCQNFLPYEFRIKVIPMLLPGNVRNIPFNPDELHTPILKI